MFVYLFSLLFATSAWPGVWEITAEKLQGGTETYYLVIQDGDTAQLYDHQWYPQLIKTIELDETTVKMGITFEGVVMPTALEGHLDGDNLKGTITFNFPQYEINSTFSAERVVSEPIQPPAEHTPGIIEGRTVNIVRYLAENAPRGSFDEFSRFWCDKIAPRYFVFLEPLLPETKEEAEDTLKKVFESLDELEKNAREQIDRESDSETDYTVLVPAAKERAPMTLEIYSERKEWPPDYSPCCGDKLFNLRKFRLVTVAP